MNTHLRYMPSTPLVQTKSPTYHLTTFPPNPDFVVSVDKAGLPRSRYGDMIWDFSAYTRKGNEQKFRYNFGVTRQGSAGEVNQENIALIKQVAILCLYHPGLFPGSIQGLKGYLSGLKKTGAFCTRKGILMSDLHRFPRLFDEYSNEIKPGSRARSNSLIGFLHNLEVYSEDLGFLIADKALLRHLSARVEGDREAMQTPCIPPRIWEYQVRRLDQILNDFLDHQEQIEGAFNTLIAVYRYNSKPVSAASKKRELINPFFKPGEWFTDKRIQFFGDFTRYAEVYGIADLINNYSNSNREECLTLQSFHQTLSIATKVALFFIANYSLQRRQEFGSLRTDCFQIERDHRLGDIAMVVGETTKTDPDSDARWVVPTHVEKAVRVATFIAKLRYQVADEEFKKDYTDPQSIPLAIGAAEPWSPFQAKNFQVADYSLFLNWSGSILDQQEIVIGEEDARIALSLTPTISRREWFAVGKPWRFASHQLRRTANVLMASSGDVSLSTIQWENKHRSRYMSIYYGRNHTNLRFNKNAAKELIGEVYQSLARNCSEAVLDQDRFVRPHSNHEPYSNKVINLVSEKSAEKLVRAAKNNEVSCRRTLLGLCTKLSCEFGGIESISKCAGAEGGGICPDAIFDRLQGGNLVGLKEGYISERKNLKPHQPRYKALGYEILAIDTYLDVMGRS